MNMTRIAVAVVVTGALTALGAASASGAEPTRARGAGQLRDLQAGTEQPTVHATAQVVAVESDGVRFVVEARSADVDRWGVFDQAFLFGVAVEAGDRAEPTGDRGPGASASLQMAGEGLDVGAAGVEDRQRVR